MKALRFKFWLTLTYSYHILIWRLSFTDGELTPELLVASRGWPGREQQRHAVRSTRAQPPPLPQVQGCDHDDRIHAACVEK